MVWTRKGSLFLRENVIAEISCIVKGDLRIEQWIRIIIARKTKRLKKN